MSVMPPRPVERVIQDIVREEWGRILASLTKSLGDMQLAEDCLQDAVIIAMEHWQKVIPDVPAAWLITTARRKAIDRLRREQNFAAKSKEIAYITQLEQEEAMQHNDAPTISDERLQMIFTCCHPALDEKARVALTLRTLGGLTTDEIAAAFLDKPKTMAQRLVRAKNKIKVAGIPYQVPERDMLPERLGSVLKVIYLIFNEGYSARAGASLMRISLSNEAIRLARIMTKLMPEIPEISGLLSLMLITDARRYARVDASGNYVPLEHQDRGKWDKLQIEEGINLIKKTLPRGAVGPYQLQAAISGIHAESKSWVETDWSQIAALYRILNSVQPSPIVEMNYAVALSYADSVKAGLAKLDAIGKTGVLDNYQPFFAARADMYSRAGMNARAALDFDRAINLSQNDLERVFLMTKARKVAGQ